MRRWPALAPLLLLGAARADVPPVPPDVSPELRVADAAATLGPGDPCAPGDVGAECAAGLVCDDDGTGTTRCAPPTGRGCAHLEDDAFVPAGDGTWVAGGRVTGRLDRLSSLVDPGNPVPASRPVDLPRGDDLVAGRIDPALAGFVPVRARVRLTDWPSGALAVAEVPVVAPARPASGAACRPDDAFARCPPGEGRVGRPARCAPVRARLDGGAARLQTSLPTLVELRLRGALQPDTDLEVHAVPLDASGRALAGDSSRPVRTRLDSAELRTMLPVSVPDARALRVWVSAPGLPDAGPIDVPLTMAPRARAGAACWPSDGSGLGRDCEPGLLCLDRARLGRGVCGLAEPPAPAAGRVAPDEGGVWSLGVTGTHVAGAPRTAWVTWLDARGREAGQAAVSLQPVASDLDGAFVAAGRFQGPVPAATAARIVVRDAWGIDSAPSRVPVGRGPVVAAGGRCRGAPLDRCAGGTRCVRDQVLTYAFEALGRCARADQTPAATPAFHVRDDPPGVTLAIVVPEGAAATATCRAVDGMGRPLPAPLDLECDARHASVTRRGGELVVTWSWTLPSEHLDALDELAAFEVRHAGRRLVAMRSWRSVRAVSR